MHCVSFFFRRSKKKEKQASKSPQSQMLPIVTRASASKELSSLFLRSSRTLQVRTMGFVSLVGVFTPGLTREREVFFTFFFFFPVSTSLSTPTDFLSLFFPIQKKTSSGIPRLRQRPREDRQGPGRRGRRTRPDARAHCPSLVGGARIRLGGRRQGEFFLLFFSFFFSFFCYFFLRKKSPSPPPPTPPRKFSFAIFLCLPLV